MMYTLLYPRDILRRVWIAQMVMYITQLTVKLILACKLLGF
jgi:hypothetical protein